jgi:hypothetical protein
MGGSVSGIVNSLNPFNGSFKEGFRSALNPFAGILNPPGSEFDPVRRLVSGNVNGLEGFENSYKDKTGEFFSATMVNPLNSAQEYVKGVGNTITLREIGSTLGNPVSAALGKDNILSKIADPIPGSFLPGQTGLEGILDNPAKGLLNSTGLEFAMNTGKDLIGGVGSLLGGGGEGVEEPQQSGGNLAGNPDDARTSAKRILRGGNSRRRRGFSGGSTSLSPANGGTTTLLGS